MIDSILLQQILNGIFEGSVYALMAVGLSLIFGVLEVVNFAHGEFYAIGGYITYLLCSVFGFKYEVTVAITCLALAVLGGICEKIFIEPLIERHWLMPIVTTFGLSIIIQNLLRIIFSPDVKKIPTLYSAEVLEFLGVRVSYQRIIVIFGALISFLLLHIFLYKTKTGKAIRAASQNKEACSIVGIDLKKVYLLAFSLSTMFCGLAGSIASPVFCVSPMMGSALLLKAFAVVILGGFGNVKGAILSAYIIGCIESFAGAYISYTFKDMFGFIIMVIVLLFKPQGIFGKKVGI
jgi:branched-chain amino acid transport system permease protein